MSLPEIIDELARPLTVTRRSAPVYDGSSPRPTIPAAQTAVVSIAAQRDNANPTELVRTLDGDETTGELRIWVSDEALAAAYDPDDPGTPLGWTELRIAPPESTDGPPGDQIAYRGRLWEITELVGWYEDFDGDAGFQRYLAKERGAA